MKIVPFEKIKDELVSNFQRKMLFPIIGSGFTRNCKSYKGIVPSGDDYRNYMISKILEIESEHLTQEDIKNLHNDSFSNISTLYHKILPKSSQEEYLRNNFTKVKIEENKKNFLSLDWPYIYTLNIDDGIETNSDYNHIVYANRSVNENVFDEEKCIIKLHGDISDMLTYSDSNSEIFTQEQYISSLKKNRSLLKKLEHDATYQNLIFIGCSLDDEIDLLSSLIPNEKSKNIISKYICVTKEPSYIEKIKYEKYGITHCIIFDSFDSIYEGITSVGIEAQKISLDDLENYKSFSIKNLSSDYDKNSPYLLFGKGLINQKHEITIPYYFISREQSKTIINNINTYSLQLLIGGRCSGKSYVLTDIAQKVRDRDVFYFESKDRLSERAFNSLLQKENCLILADSLSLTRSQFEFLLDNVYHLKVKKLNFIVVINKNDRELNSIIKLYEIQEKIKSSDICKLDLSSHFTTSELNKLNPLLTAIDIGVFNNKKTIVDNIITTSNNLTSKNKYYDVTPKLQTTAELAALIALATERKIYSSRAIKLNISEQLYLQKKVAEPLIDCEATWSFEKSNKDNSPVKYVINAEYWLCNFLKDFSSNVSNHKIIVDAYKYIISEIIAQEETRSIFYDTKNTSYKDYVLFDNINRIFSPNKISGEIGMQLIRVIYEGLNDLLSVDPNYMHQRSKCYIKSSYYEKEIDNKLYYLDKAYRDANVASQIFTHRYESSENDKLLISIDHISYTQALILCHKCYIKSYKDIEENSNAVEKLYIALSSPYNSYDFAKKDLFNYQNVIGEIVFKTISNKNLVSEETYKILEDLFKFISE